MDERVSARRRPSAAIAAVVVGVIVSGGLAFAAALVHGRNENRLLDQRTREAAAVLLAALPSIQTPLASAAELLEATDGADPTAFSNLMEQYVERGQPYVSASVWEVGSVTPIMVVGRAPKLATRPEADIRAFLERSVETEQLAVIALLDGDDPTLGYSFTSARSPIRFVAYAEAALPPDRLSAVPSDNAFSGLDNAIYLGDREDSSTLLSASTADLPLPEERSSQTIPFGDTSLTLVMHPTGELGGDLMAVLPWLIGGVGLLCTGGAATVLMRLERRRREAERLAAENARLYAEQRNVAQTLQHSLLPERLPELPDIEIAVRYEAGDQSVDVGGDWYDVIPLDGRRVLLVVGDVSGRGIKAATIMASLRYGIDAFASLGLAPHEILKHLGRLVDVERDRHFATIVCVLVDGDDETLTIANAGHPSPLMIVGGSVGPLDSPIGPPVGVQRRPAYESCTVPLPREATLLMFTDGLFERRGETIDDGLARLQSAVDVDAPSVDELLTTVLRRQRHEGAHDDTAILGLRWHRAGAPQV